MSTRLLAIALLLILNYTQGFSQNRTIDGTSNNIQNPEWGAVGHQLRAITSNGFADGISEPGGTNRPNPRIISNTLFAQDSLIMDPMGLSDYTWVFGQLIDHDVILTPSDATEDISIPINFPDPHFNPGGAFPFIEIHMNRSLAHPGTGTGVNNPRAYTNAITSWIDASSVYGSDTERADYLRTFQNGKLKTSSGNLLPFNTETYEYGAAIDPLAPFMDNENPSNDQLFVAGDSRANENVALAAFHTIFVREHNRLCDELILEHPDWTDEELYQYARKLVSGYTQAIVYNEWLPTMGVHLPPYSGYDPGINPTISNVFSAAAFRLGHTLLSRTLPRKDNSGNTIPEGDLTLLEAFFTPHEIVENGGIDPIFKGLATQTQQQLDCKVVDDVRNFLFGPPQAGLGGLDLASININRGRERGLPDFNTMRQDLGFTPYNGFSEIHSDSEVVDAMEALYGDINDIDPWVGMLAEESMPNALFGPTIMKIMEDQFFALREGDRFYYENDPALSQEEKEMIANTTFRDIIMRNTGITVMQMNVFRAISHDSICPAESPLANIDGTVRTIDGDMVEGVDIDVRYIESGDLAGMMTTEQGGIYLVEDLETCDHYELTAAKNSDHGNGVSTFDIIFIRRHILETQQFDDAYKYLSADVNGDGNLTTLDMVEIRKIILNLQDTFTNNLSWRFIDDQITFADPNHPIEAVLDQARVNYLPGNTAVNFVGLKIGDVTGDADPQGLLGGIEQRSREVNYLEVENQKLEAGKEYTINFKNEALDQLLGAQFTIDFDETIAIEELMEGAVSNWSDANYRINEEAHSITVSWDGETTSSESVFFSLRIKAMEEGFLSDFVRLNSNSTKAEAYTSDLEIQNLELQFKDNSKAGHSDFLVYQNIPNPFTERTDIRFSLPQADKVLFSVYDLSGRLLYAEEGNYGKGNHLIRLNSEQLKSNGMLYYQLSTSLGSVTKKMLLTGAVK